MDLTNGAINISPIAVRVGLYEWYHICPVALEYVVPGVLFLRSKVSPDIILCG